MKLKRKRENKIKSCQRDLSDKEDNAEEVERTEERAGTSSALLFGWLDFRVTRVMILVAAAGSRIANRRETSNFDIAMF